MHPPADLFFKENPQNKSIKKATLKPQKMSIGKLSPIRLPELPKDDVKPIKKTMKKSNEKKRETEFTLASDNN
jgi:hypothetical protein